MSKEKNKELKRLINGYITLPKISTDSYSLRLLQDELKKYRLHSNPTITTIGKQAVLIMDSYSQKIENIVKPIQEMTKRFEEITRPLVDTVKNLNFVINPYFYEIAEKIRKAEENPDSLLNWIEYSEKLEKYFWTFPFEMKSEELKYVLQNVNSEKEFDKYMLKYFSKAKISKLEKSILEMLPHKHKIMFKQIMNSFYNKNYGIANLGITAIIDDLCTYFLEDKGCSSRKDLFLPIIEKVDDGSNDVFEVIPLVIINANINVLYESIDFRKRITLSTHKTARRNPGQHGKKFSNKRLDTIMLLNTIYYILVVIEKFSKYKDKVIRVGNEKEFQRADFQGNYNKDRKFYIKKKYFRKTKKIKGEF